MARQVATLLLAVLAARAAHAVVLRGGDQMRPDMVAKTLVNVEEEWRKLAAVFTESNSSTKETPGAFAKSCSTVVSAVIQGSGGDRTVAKEYMSNVCNQKVLEGWHKLRCTTLASAITDHAMLADNYANRQNFSPMKVCRGYWTVFVEAEKTREAEEAKLRAEQEKVRAEEEKKAAAAAAEAKKIADEKAKVEAEKKAKEEAEHAKEEQAKKAKEEAEEAKKRAAEAATKLAEKKAEAEKVAKEAQQKLEEAAKAEKEHQERLAEHQRAEELLHNATKSVPEVANATKSVPAEASPAALKPAPKEVAPAKPVDAKATNQKAEAEAKAKLEATKPVVAKATEKTVVAKVAEKTTKK